MSLAGTFLRAYAVVTITAANVVLIQRHAWGAMFVSGALLSWIWWTNTRTANRRDGRAHQLAYSLGAGCGTLTGAFLASRW